MKNKLMSLCLAVSILSGCLWGCAAPSGTAGGSTGEQQTKSKTQEEKQQEVNSFGQYNALSFNGNKIITTSGGGMLLSDDEAGTCIIEMPDEIIDASASTQLKNIRDLIHEI